MPNGLGDLLQFARTHVLDSVRHARSSVWLASPFLSRPVAQRLAAASSESAATDMRMITAVQELSVRARALDPAGLRVLQDAGFAIRTIGNLHAKVTLVDGTWGLVGSGNLTNAGLGKASSDKDRRANVELGVLLAPRQVIEATTIFSAWWEVAADVSAKRLNELAALPRLRREPLPGPMLPVSTNAAIEALLSESESDAGAREHLTCGSNPRGR